MTALSELFTPTFLMFLGILLLVVALVVVYFESKMRDQNHKIASMLSLVSTLAEDMNGVKMGLNQVAMHQMGQMGQMGGQQMGQMGGQMAQTGVQSQPLENSNKSLYLQEANNLIAVSDDDDSEEDADSVMDDSGSDIDAASLSDEEDDESSDEDEQLVKVLRLNIPAPGNNEDMGFNGLGDLDDLMDEALSLSSEDSSEYQLDIQASDFISAEEIKDETHLNISASDLKTINISLEEGGEEHGVESVDYKKLPLPKLRNIVTEKGLAADAAKMKKNELLKLLESE